MFCVALTWCVVNTDKWQMKLTLFSDSVLDSSQKLFKKKIKKERTGRVVHVFSFLTWVKMPWGNYNVSRKEEWQSLEKSGRDFWMSEKKNQWSPTWKSVRDWMEDGRNASNDDTDATCMCVRDSRRLCLAKLVLSGIPLTSDMNPGTAYTTICYIIATTIMKAITHIFFLPFVSIYDLASSGFCLYLHRTVFISVSSLQPWNISIIICSLGEHQGR